MSKLPTLTTTMREIDRIKTVQAVIDGDLKPGRAAERLGLSDRQLRRLLERYRQDGPRGLTSRRRGKASNHQLPDGVAARAMAIVRDRYADFGPTLAAEKLASLHDIRLSKETVRQLMIDAALWIPRKQRPPRIHQPRQRRASVGELIQIDGSEHRWFEDRAPSCSLLVFVDDATSALMHLHFSMTESTFAYFVALHGYLGQHGKPMAFYSDKAGIFRVNGKPVGGNGITQFGRALFELSITGLCANTPQAKGRVERAHLTLQDRLVKELRLRGISTIEAANAFAPDFIASYNRSFSKPARDLRNAHRPVRADEDLDLILTWREHRLVSSNLTLQYEKRLYMLRDSPLARRLAGKYADVYEFPDGRLEVRASGKALPYSIYDKMAKVEQGAVVDHKRLGAVLRLAQLVEAQRDEVRTTKAPSRRHLTGLPTPKHFTPGKIRQEAIRPEHVTNALNTLVKEQTAT